MAEEVGRAFVSVIPSMKGFSADIKRQLTGDLRAVDGVASEVGGRAGRSFGSRFHDSAKGFVSKLGTTLKIGLVAATAGAVAGLGAITAFGLKSAAALEQTQIGFEALLGSAQQATDFMSQLQQFAAKTPFEFQGVADAARRILAFGDAVGITRDEVIPTITTIGDLASVLGVGQQEIDSVVRALGQISSKGKVSQEELLQLAEALPGFNVNAAIAAHLGISVADSMKLITAGGVDARTGIEAVLEGMAKFKGAAGAMEKQSQTLLGVFSTFKDTISIALANAFTPVIPQLKQTLTDVTPVIGDALNKLAPVLGKFLASVLPILGGLVSALAPVMTVILDALNDLTSSIDIGFIFNTLGEAITQLVTAARPLLPVIGQVIAQVLVGLAPVLVTLAQVITQLPLQQMLELILPLIPTLLQLAAAVVTILVPLADLINTLLVNTGLLDLIAEGVLLLADGISWLTEKVTEFVQWIGKIDWGAVGSAIGDAFGNVVQFFKDLPGNIGAFLSNLPSMLGNLAREAFDRFTYAIGFGIGLAIRAFKEMPGRILGFIVFLWMKAGELFSNGVSKAKTTITDGIARIIETARSLPGRFIEAMKTLPGKLHEFGIGLIDKAWQLGKDIVSGIINGIRSLGGKITEVLLDGVNNAVKGVKDALGISSPSKVFAQMGEQSVQGYALGVKNTAAQASAALTTTISPAANAPASRPAPQAVQIELVGGDDNILTAIKEAIRVRNGGDVQGLLGTA